jgi:hypothetical protein
LSINNCVLSCCSKYKSAISFVIQSAWFAVAATSRLSCDFLLLWTPWKNSRIKTEIITRGASHIINTSYLITIKIVIKIKFFNMIESYSIINCLLYI